MPNVLHINPVLAIELNFKREDTQDLRDPALHAANAVLTPSPKLRRHEVNDRHAAAVKFAGNAEVEGGRVNHNCQVGACDFGSANQPVKFRINFGQMTEDLSHAKNGEVPGIDNNVASGRAHLDAANTHALQRWLAAAQDRYQLRAIPVTGSFAGRDEQLHVQSSAPTGWREPPSPASDAPISWSLYWSW